MVGLLRRPEGRGERLTLRDSCAMWLLDRLPGISRRFFELVRRWEGGKG
jgi:hypothetical protein